MRVMCSMCRQVKDKSEFYYRRDKNKYNCYCREWERIYQREYKRSYRELNPNYVEKNRIKMRELMKKRSENK